MASMGELIDGGGIPAPNLGAMGDGTFAQPQKERDASDGITYAVIDQRHGTATGLCTRVAQG